MNIFEVIASRDRQKMIEVVDAAFKSAARKASARAHAKYIEVADIPFPLPCLANDRPVRRRISCCFYTEKSSLSIVSVVCEI